jgi:hypothetical protein
MAINKDTDPNFPIKIYALVDPRNNQVRYIGWTSKELEKRLSQHISEVNRFNTHKNNWIKNLFEYDLVPIIQIIEDTIYERRTERESYWIKYYGRENLTNSTDGGEGKLGSITSPETKIKLSNAFSGEKHPLWGIPMSQETKDKISKSNTGKKRTEEEKQRRQKRYSGEGNPMYGVHRFGDKSPAFAIKHKESSSGFYGVSWKNKSSKWNVSINGKYFCLADKEESAAICYDICIVFGNLKNPLNFPELRENYISYLNQYEISDIKELRQIIKNYIKEDT